MYTVEQKREKYKTLCKEVATFYKDRELNATKDKVFMKWCEDNEEINLWTYWQGRNSFSPKILLVGQDWGCPEDRKQQVLIGNIRAIKQGLDRNIMEGNHFQTDHNLVELFDSIGYPEIGQKKYEDLFFTNLILGYRNHGSSGSFDPLWLTKEEKTFFSRLVAILEPKIILCLGRNTFEGVLSAMEIPNPIKHSYNVFIEDEKLNPVATDNGCYIFALAHCGARGTQNRNNNKSSSCLDIQKNDWSRIKAYL